MSEARKVAIAEPQMMRFEQPTSEVTALIHMIERAARDTSIDMDKMERLLVMQERVLTRKSVSEFNEAMSAAQSEMMPVAADSNNPQTRSKYASYYALDKALRPIYTKHGFALSFNTDAGAPEQHVRVVCRVSHNSGHCEHYQFDMPADGKGAKGGDVMTKTHAAGSAVTYGMRYLLKMIFNIAVGERDDDGNDASSGDKLDEKQVETVRSLIVEVAADLPKFLKYFKVERIADIPAKHYQRAIDALEAKRAKQ